MNLSRSELGYYMDWWPSMAYHLAWVKDGKWLFIIANGVVKTVFCHRIAFLWLHDPGQCFWGVSTEISKQVSYLYWPLCFWGVSVEACIKGYYLFLPCSLQRCVKGSLIFKGDSSVPQELVEVRRILCIFKFIAFGRGATSIFSALPPELKLIPLFVLFLQKVLNHLYRIPVRL